MNGKNWWKASYNFNLITMGSTDKQEANCNQTIW